MRSVVIGLMFGSGVLVAMPHSAAAVNCEQVRRYLNTGRSVEDVADTMVVSVDDVKKCQQGGDKGEQKPAPTPAAKQ